LIYDKNFGIRTHKLYQNTHALDLSPKKRPPKIILKKVENNQNFVLTIVSDGVIIPNIDEVRGI